jgi:hypothetical protein
MTLDTQQEHCTVQFNEGRFNEGLNPMQEMRKNMFGVKISWQDPAANKEDIIKINHAEATILNYCKCRIVGVMIFRRVGRFPRGIRLKIRLETISQPFNSGFC